MGGALWDFSPFMMRINYYQVDKLSFPTAFEIQVLIPMEKYSSHTSSEGLLFAVDREIPNGSKCRGYSAVLSLM